jgi:hypothetical protein
VLYSNYFHNTCIIVAFYTNNTLPDTGISSIKIYKIQGSQGSPHLEKIGSLDFSLREHEGEVKA